MGVFGNKSRDLSLPTYYIPEDAIFIYYDILMTFEL